MAKLFLWSSLLTILFSLDLVFCYPTGPPIGKAQDTKDICGTMIPWGHAKTTPGNGPAPFQIDVSSSCYQANQTLQVRVRRMDSSKTYFEGFLVEARHTSTENSSHGTFSPGGNANLQTFNCFNKTASALSQNNNKHYWYQVLNWIAPTNFTDSLMIVTTVIHDKGEFFLVQSSMIMYNANCAVNSALTAVGFPEVKSSHSKSVRASVVLVWGFVLATAFIMR